MELSHASNRTRLFSAARSSAGLKANSLESLVVGHLLVAGSEGGPFYSSKVRKKRG